MDQNNDNAPLNSASGEVSQVRDSFRKALDEGQDPKLEDFLRGSDEPTRSILLDCLLQLELTYHRQNGVKIDRQQYRDRFPDHRLLVDARLLEGPADTSNFFDQPTNADFIAATVDPLVSDTDGGSGGNTGAASSSPQGIGKLPELAGYEVLGPIGKGGMGLVLKARHLSLDRLVAIKVPLLEHLPGSMHHERFMREARAAARLRHPNICPIYDVAEQHGRPYLAMAHVTGTTLRVWAREQSPTARQSAETVAAVARAVDYAHSQGVIHRDIKPGNVMIEEVTGKPMLMDFGLAKDVYEDDVQLTQTGQVMGTPAYMAPEQAAGKPDEVGPPTDVYALGAVLYELLSGRAPFKGTSGEIIHLVQSEKPAALRKIAPNLHRDLETICMKAMAKAPDDRYESAAAMATDLTRFCSGEAILAKPERLISRVARTVRRHALSIAAFALLIAVAATAVSYFALGASKIREMTAWGQAFDEQLEADVWTKDSLHKMESILSKIRAKDPQRADECQKKLSDGFATYIRIRMIGKARIEERDLVDIERALELLQQRDPELSSMLRQELNNRSREWQTKFQVASPYNNVDQVFTENEYKVASGKGICCVPKTQATSQVLLTKVECVGNVGLRVAFGEDWTSAEKLGILLRANSDHRYQMRIRQASGDSNPTATSKSFASAGRKGGYYMEILRGNTVLRRTNVLPISELNGTDDRSLQLDASVEDNKLEFRVGKRRLVFDDMFAISSTSRNFYGVLLPASVSVTSITGIEQALPVTPSSLELGDELFFKEEWNEALTLYQQQARDAGDPQVQSISRYKQALCLLRMKHSDEAIGMFQQLLNAQDKRVSGLASCQLWLFYLQNGLNDEANEIFTDLQSQYDFEQLALLVPDAERREIIERTFIRASGPNMLVFGPTDLQYVERAVAVEKLLAVAGRENLMRYWALARGYHVLGQIEHAISVLEPLTTEAAENGMNSVGQYSFSHIPLQFVEEYSWLLRQLGDHHKALKLIDSYLDQELRFGRESKSLLVERARVQIALSNWDGAEKDLDAYLADSQIHNIYRDYSAACLTRGYLLKRRGLAQEAEEAWRSGFYERWLEQRENDVPRRQVLTGAEIENALLLRVVCKECTSEDLNRLVDAGSDHTDIGFRVFAKGLTPTIVPVIIRMGSDQRNVQELEKVVFQQVGLRTWIRSPIILGFLEFTEPSAREGKWSADEEQLVRQLGQDSLDLVANRGLANFQIVRLLATWKGTTGFLGWNGVKAALPPDVRGPTAYVLGHRYLQRFGKPQAREFFRTALDDAEDDSQLKILATTAIRKLDEDEKK